MECDGVECSVGEVRQKAWTSDWVAVIHYADISVVAHTIIVQQVQFIKYEMLQIQMFRYVKQSSGARRL